MQGRNLYPGEPADSKCIGKGKESGRKPLHPEIQVEDLIIVYSAMPLGDQLAAQLEQRKDLSVASGESLKAFQDRIW